MEETWRKIDDYEGYYEISSAGNVKSLGRYDRRGCFLNELILKPTMAKNGHLFVVLRKNGKTSTKQISRLVAAAFPEICGKMFNGCHVHHIDYDPLNNRPENLLVVSPDEHITIHKHKNRKNKNVIYKYDKNWNFLEAYENPKYAAASVNGSVNCLYEALKSDSHLYYGYRWLVA